MIIASLTDLPREGESNGLVIITTIVCVPSVVQALWTESKRLVIIAIPTTC